VRQFRFVIALFLILVGLKIAAVAMDPTPRRTGFDILYVACYLVAAVGVWHQLLFPVILIVAKWISP
jgi:hypothetical protein